MITYKALLSGNVLSDVPLGHQLSLDKLLQCLVKLEEAYEEPLPAVTSGYRTMQHHLEIYSRKGITDPSKVPMQSKHLYGKATDLADPTGVFYNYCFANQDVLAECGLWLEADTKGWVHLQCEAPASGKRVFHP